jgi:hypothetical protein
MGSARVNSRRMVRPTLPVPSTALGTCGALSR